MADLRHRGLRLLLLAEQVTRRSSFANLPAPIYLGKLKTEDGRVAFETGLYSTSTRHSLFLWLYNIAVTAPCLVHIKMTGRHDGTTDQDPNPCADAPTAEALVVLKCDETRTKNSVTSLHLEDKPYEKVTVLCTVYDLFGFRPKPSTGLHLNHARLQGAHCDVKLVVDGVELPAHRTVLAVRSAVLSNMLTGDFKEAREGRIQLVDTSRVAVEKFLEYIYTDYIENWEGSELELLHLADKYMVPELRTECSMRLWSCDPLQALEVLHAAAAGLSEVISSSLRQRLTSIVVDNIKALAVTEPWAELRAAQPFLVDILLGSSANKKSSEYETSVWTP